MNTLLYNGLPLPALPELPDDVPVGNFPYRVIGRWYTLEDEDFGTVNRYHLYYFTHPVGAVHLFHESDDSVEQRLFVLSHLDDPNAYGPVKDGYFCRWTWYDNEEYSKSYGYPVDTWNIDFDIEFDPFVTRNYHTLNISAQFGSDKWVWSNTDLYWWETEPDVGGTLYLAGSEPKPVPFLNLKMWLTGLLAGLTTVPGRAAWYAFNGATLPALPYWGKCKKPYALIFRDESSGVYGLYQFDKKPLFITLGDPVSTLYLGYDDTTVRLYYWEGVRWKQSSESVKAAGDDVMCYTVVWTNFDLETGTGESVMAGTTPVPVRKPKREPVWEVLFEGEVTTVESAYGVNGYEGQVPVSESPIFSGGESIRITVNGASGVYTAIDTSSYGISSAYIGNVWLDNVPNTPNADDGSDYYVATSEGSIVAPSTRFLTRSPGTYTVKIERHATTES